MHSSQLQAAVDHIKLDIEPELTEELQYMCSAMGTKLPFLPVSGHKEHLTFAKFILDMPYPFDYEQMAIEWCKYVDGIHVWPKLPVYLRTYHKQFQRNQRVKDAVSKAKTGAEKLKMLNKEASSGLSPATASAHLPSTMPQAPSVARRDDSLVLVGGSAVGGVPLTLPGKRKRKNGERSGDKKKRADRRCTNCQKHKLPDEDARVCPGRAPSGKCLHAPFENDAGGRGSGEEEE